MMSSVNRFLSLLLAALLTACLTAAVYAKNVYVHDPRENAAAMADIVEDPNAVYGFRPSKTGSLKQYADADWSDPVLVENSRKDRIAYHESVQEMYVMLDEMAAAGKTVEEIARAVSTKRNELRLAAYKDDPEGLATVKERNLEKYGHEEGPLPDESFEKYGSWEIVIEKAFSLNIGMDVCLGLYDEYYPVYQTLSRLSARAASPGTGDRPAVWLILTLTAVLPVIAAVRRKHA